MEAIAKRTLRDEVGATAIEYALIAAAIAIVIVTVLGTVGGKLRIIFTTLSTGL